MDVPGWAENEISIRAECSLNLISIGRGRTMVDNGDANNNRTLSRPFIDRSNDEVSDLTEKPCHTCSQMNT